ncbi:MAG: hypothetical protein U0610_04415 [bacterium]
MLLRGVNSSPRVVKELMHNWCRNRIRPYYLFQYVGQRGRAGTPGRPDRDRHRDHVESLRGADLRLRRARSSSICRAVAGRAPVAPNYLNALTQSKALMRNFEVAPSLPQPLQTDCTVKYEDKWMRAGNELAAAASDAAQRTTSRRP